MVTNTSKKKEPRQLVTWETVLSNDHDLVNMFIEHYDRNNLNIPIKF